MMLSRLQYCCKYRNMNIAARSRYCVMNRREITNTCTRGLTTSKCKGMTANERYCMNLVRSRDWEGYICTLLFPKAARRSAFAVRAFNTELSQVGSVTTGSAVAQMRLNFWKQCLDLVYDEKPPASPPAIELYDAVKKHNLSKIWLKRMISAREDYIDFRGFHHIKALEDYADDTCTAQLCLLLQCLGIEDIHCDHVASHIGKAQGIITVIRATPYHAAMRKVHLPLQFLAKHSVSQQDIIQGSDDQNVRDLINDLASQAYVHLEHARQIGKDIPKKAKAAFLCTAVLDWYLRNLEEVDFNVFHRNLQQRNTKLPFTVSYRHLRKKL